MRRKSDWQVISRLLLLGLVLFSLAVSSAYAGPEAATVEFRLAALEAKVNIAAVLILAGLGGLVSTL